MARTKRKSTSRTKRKTKAKSNQPTPQRLMQIAWGFAPPLIIEAAMRHGLFDLLDSGPRTADEIARDTGASARGVRAICNALASIDFLKKDRKDRYSLTPESSAFLVTTKPSFQGGLLRHVSRRMIPSWLQLSESVRTGGPGMAVNQQSQGADFFHELVEDIFPMSYAASQTLGDALKLSKLHEPFSVLDIAAGSGVWGIALAQKSPLVRVTAVDWAKVIPVTRRFAERFGLLDRFNFVEGDIQEANFGSAHNLATLGHILHSEGTVRSRQLLGRVFNALAPGGTIVIAEFVTNKEHTGPPNATIFAVNMLVHTEQGNAFSFEEIRSWLSEIGFVKVRMLEAPAPSPLIIANKPR